MQRIVDIFNQRIDTAADDSFYPETAQLWAQNAQVQTEGNYVAPAALPDGYTVPEGRGVRRRLKSMTKTSRVSKKELL